MYEFFVRTLFQQLFSSYMYIVKSAKRISYEKFVRLMFMKSTPGWRTCSCSWPENAECFPLDNIPQLPTIHLKLLWHVYTSGFRMRFLHCVAISYYLPRFCSIKVSNKRLQCNEENECRNQVSISSMFYVQLLRS